MSLTAAQYSAIDDALLKVSPDPTELPTGEQIDAIGCALITHESMRETVRAELDQYPDDGPGAEDRVHARVQFLFDLAYDDEDEPDVAIQDALTDLLHEAARRGVDFENTLETARRHWGYEREEFGLDQS